MKKNVRRLILVGVILVIGWFAGPPLIGYFVQGPGPERAQTSARFQEIPTSFVHTSDFDEALPFMALATIDVDGDGRDEVFAGGGIGQDDALLAFDGTTFAAHVFSADFEGFTSDATYGALSLDLEPDGWVDLLVARNSGIYVYGGSADGFRRRAHIVLPDSTAAPLSLAVTDLENDGVPEIFASGYLRQEFVEGETIFNQEYGAYSMFFSLYPDGRVVDRTSGSGLRRRHNTFVAVFVDLDNDSDDELVIAHDTGMPAVWKNLGDGTFAAVELPVTFSYPMGIGVGDMNNDSQPDLYFSNVGPTLPNFLLKGDLRKDQPLYKDYILLENTGGLTFSDVARARGAARIGFGWGVLAEDLTGDGRDDLLVMQNYVRFPGVKLLELYEGHLLEQQAEGSFAAVERTAGLANPYFGVTAAVSDFDGNGTPDVILANLDGPLRVFLNQADPAQWVAVPLSDRVENMGARVRLVMDNGTERVRYITAGEGLGSDSTPTVFMGLGTASRVDTIEVRLRSGVVRTHAPVGTGRVPASAWDQL